ncbi:MAG: hypothetical protein ACYS83_11015 [Planctomycetota bacterium]|jgi:outer membrane lipoprotein-sorting protein
MIGVEDIEALVRDLNIPTTVDMDRRVLAVGLAAYEKSIKTMTRPNVYTLITRSKIARSTVAVAIIIAFLWGIIDWPSGSPKNGKWWLGPPAAWGQEIIASLDRIQALVHRARSATVPAYGPTEFSTNWARRYYAKDNSWRRDRYNHDGKTLTNTTWIVHDGDVQRKIEVSYEYECYFEETGNWEYYERGIWEYYRSYDKELDRLRWYVGLLDRADRILGTRIFEGRECVGFEIAGDKYGSELDGRFDVIWFDVETHLPARIENHGCQSSYRAGSTLTIIEDQFEYYAEVPADLFEPNIPEGFINAHPDEVRAARDRETKGEMVFADVPEGLTEEIAAALNGVETGVYRDRTYYNGKGIYSDPKYVYLSENAWLIECYSGEELQTTTVFIIQQDADASLLELEERTEACLLEEWHCDYDANTVKVIGRTIKSQFWRRWHPMDHILFLVGFCDRADRFIEEAVIGGVECFGFEISAKKYGNNRDGVFHRLWFDSETKLLVRTEFHSEGDRRLIWSNKDSGTTTVHDQFQWNLDLPADVFEPNIPEGFIYVYPSEEPAARDHETKEEIILTDVPEGLLDEIIAALRDVETGVYVIMGESPYQQGPRYMYFSKNAWRKDHYSGEELRATRLWVVQHSDANLDANLFEPEDNARVVEEWQYDYRANTVRVIRHTIEPTHPMDRMLRRISFCDRADRFIEHALIDGVECFGFEISAKKYGDNPDGMFHLLWFDIETKLPERTEFVWLEDGKLRQPMKIPKDQFQWNPELPSETFAPGMPEGFTLTTSEDPYRSKQSSEQRHEQKSNPLTDLPFSVPRAPVDIQIEVLQVRGKVSIAQFPSEQNDYELVVAFNDDKLGGPEWYEVVIHVSPVGGGEPFGIYVKAYIDGISRLVFRDNTVFWHHLRWALPGRHGGHNYPTYINEVEWVPKWPQEERADE